MNCMNIVQISNQIATIGKREATRAIGEAISFSPSWLHKSVNGEKIKGRLKNKKNRGG